MDRTAFFRQCVDIYSDELAGILQEKKNDKVQREDTTDQLPFLNTANSIYKSIKSISGLINDIKDEYLITNSNVMSDASKLLVDMEIKQQFQVMSAQIKKFQSESSKLEELDSESIELSERLIRLGMSRNKVSRIDNLTRNLVSFGDYSEYVKIRNDSLRSIFSQIIKGLSFKLQKVVEEWNAIYGKRNEQLVQLKKSKIQVPTWAENQHRLTNYSGSNENEMEYQFVDDESGNLDEQLPQEELLQLQEEQNDLLLQLKQGTIEQVEQIETQIGDVANIVSEIGMQLSLQNSNISILNDLKDDIVVNVQSGNKELLYTKNNRKNTLAIMIFTLSFILLIVDYIL